DAWRDWRTSDKWQKWSQTIAPAVALRRQAFSLLRDNDAVSILFEELAERFADRDGGYTRVVRLPNVRLGDSGQQALIEFVGERDRVKSRKRTAPVVAEEPVSDEPAPQQDDPVAVSEEASAVDDDATDTTEE
ncbi:MAG: 50S ribosomal protein L17, partial [Fuerstiella sp.]|nr:50S ribosomal protein L17 [Fuerstiella sp.]